MFFTVLLVFVIIRLIPSDPAAMLLLADATPEQIAKLRALWGLDQSIPYQFLTYVTNLVQGNAGDSYQYQRIAGLPGTPAFGLVLERLPATGWLALVAITISMTIAIPLGIATALKPDGMFDTIVLAITSFLTAIPSFFMGMLLILFFSLKLRLLPTGGNDTGASVLLPAITLALHFSAVLLRVTRTEMGRVLQSEYILTARAKGLRSYTVVFIHAFKNVLIPLITIIGLRLGDLLSGAVVVESLFRWPGVGNLMIDSIIARDYPVVQVVIPMAAVIFVAINVTVDLLYGLADPRVRAGGK